MEGNSKYVFRLSRKGKNRIIALVRDTKGKGTRNLYIRKLEGAPSGGETKCCRGQDEKDIASCREQRAGVEKKREPLTRTRNDTH